MKLKSLFIAILITLILAGCSLTNAPAPQRPTLEVSHMVQSIGAVEGKEGTHDIQRFSYTMALADNTTEQIYIKEIQVTLPPEFEKRVIQKNYTIPVNKPIEPKSYIEIQNSHEFNATGLSKEEIHTLAPHISSLKVISETTIDLENMSK